MTPLDEWMTYLKTGKIKEDTHTPGLQQVREKLRVLSMTPKERRAYDEHMDNIMVQNDVLDTARDEGLAEGLAKGLAQGKAEGLAEGKAEGLAQGRVEAVIEIARTMKQQGLPFESISNFTRLSIEEFESL